MSSSTGCLNDPRVGEREAINETVQQSDGER
jgi:hypothetical protein